MSAKIKAVLDTQIFLRAAINRKSLPAKIVYDLHERFQLILSEAILTEIRNVLNRRKLRRKFPTLTNKVVTELLSLVASAQFVYPPEPIPRIARDPKDDMFLACAKAAEAQYIVSEDNDLLVLNPYDETQIINALAFMTHLQTTIESDENQ